MYDVVPTEELEDLASFEVERYVRIAVLSPDRRWLAYYVEDDPGQAVADLVLLDLTTGQRRLRSDKYNIRCLDWSPDSRWIAFVGTSFDTGFGVNRLFLAPLVGSIRVLASPATQSYERVGGGEGAFLQAEIDCGGWLDNEHILYQTFRGDLPPSFSCGEPCVVTANDANTTVVVSLDDPDAATEHPYLVEVRATCEDRSHHLLFGAAAQEWYVVPASPFLPTALPPSLSYQGTCWRMLGFVPGACLLHCYDRGQGTIEFRDPQTLEVERSFRANVDLSWSGEMIWVGDPAENVVAVIDADRTGDDWHLYLALWDMDTGDSTRIADLGGPYDYQHLIPLYWLPD